MYQIQDRIEMNTTKLNVKKLKFYHVFVMCKSYKELNPTPIQAIWVTFNFGGFQFLVKAECYKG